PHPPAAQAAPTQPSPAPVTSAEPAAAEAAGSIALGKYGCIETIPRFRNGSYEYEFEPRGAVALAADGAYTDPFGVAGTWARAGADSVRFAGGLLDGGSATPMEDEPDRIRVVIPAGERERRWSCSRS
ncbi:MAG TPA: hypothetical protein VF142_09025, partial [Longimicrobium sp.]